MRRVPVAVVQASRHSCAFCHHESGDFLARHFCPSCSQPQPLGLDEDYFAVFGLQRKFTLDRSELEKKFYQISRVLHPDRYTLSDAAVRRNSLERMGLVNQAYQTLKDPAELRDYFLKLENVGAESKSKQVPMEIAESWFELQDALMEDPQAAAPKLDAFVVELKQLQAKEDGEIARLEREIDQQDAVQRPLLEKLSSLVQARSYLSSMERDVGQKRGVRHGA